MRIIAFGTYNTDTTPRVQVILEGLRAHGVEIVECNIRLPLDTAARVKIAKQPWRVPILVIRILGCWLKLALKARHLPKADAIFIGYLGHFDIHLARLLFRGKPLILDYLISGSDTARDRHVSGGLKDKLLVWLDNAALKAATVAVVDTQEHYDRLPDQYRAKGLVVLVGAPESWFKVKKTPDIPQGHPLRVIFFGLYTPLQGTPTIAQALTQMQETSEITMIGTGQDLVESKRIATQAPKNISITWQDWVDSSALPKIVAQHDICLGVFGTGPKSSRVVPNKVYQGAAAGCAIITAATPPARRVLGESAYYVPAGDAQALATALDTLARNKKKLQSLQKAAQTLASTTFTPQQIVIPLLKRIKNLEHEKSGGRRV